MHMMWSNYVTFFNYDVKMNLSNTIFEHFSILLYLMI